MPKNVKCRRVCADFEKRVFLPESMSPSEFSNEQRLCRRFAQLKYLKEMTGHECIQLTVVELEALRLCDMEDKDQEEASRCMGISRGTLQRILYSARRKTAEALCVGKGIMIEGGNYEIADKCCSDGACRTCPLQEEKES